jgi:hypothetical protein
MEILRALAVLAEPPGPAHPRLAALLELPGAPDPAEHTQVFDLHLAPYASIYTGGEGMVGGEARERIAGFWRALRFIPPAEPDHLVSLLGLYVSLCERGERDAEPARRAMWRHAAAALLHEHLACWVFAYLEAVARLPAAWYPTWARLLAEVLARASASSLPSADPLPVHLREAPALPDPRHEGAAAFLAGVLTPVRSGMILTRADLARAARASGLALRMGERRVALAALLAQDPDATLGWLAGEARAAERRHAACAALPETVRAFWMRRAAAAAELLDALRPAPVRA